MKLNFFNSIVTGHAAFWFLSKMRVLLFSLVTPILIALKPEKPFWPTFMTNNFTKWKPISGFLKMPISKDALMSKTGPNFKLIFGEGLSFFLVKKTSQIHEYSIINMRHLQILLNQAKTWHWIVCWFLCIYLPAFMYQFWMMRS